MTDNKQWREIPEAIKAKGDDLEKKLGHLFPKVEWKVAVMVLGPGLPVFPGKAQGQITEEPQYHYWIWIKCGKEGGIVLHEARDYPDLENQEGIGEFLDAVLVDVKKRFFGTRLEGKKEEVTA